MTTRSSSCSPSRRPGALVTVRPDDAGALEAMAGALGVPLRRLGTTGGDALTVEGAFSIPLDELRAAWTTLPRAWW